MSGAVSFAKQPQTAFVELRLLAWRPRTRRARRNDDADGFELADVALSGADDLVGLVIGVAVAVLMYGLLPTVFLILAVLLFPIEVMVVVILGAALIVIRFAGIVPWTVVVMTRDGGAATERYRNVVTAFKRARAVNADGRVPLRFSLT